MSEKLDSETCHHLFCICPNRYGATNMAAVKPMMQQQQQPGGAKPNSSYNNNNGWTAAPSMQKEQSITQVGDR